MPHCPGFKTLHKNVERKQKSLWLIVRGEIVHISQVCERLKLTNRMMMLTS